MAATSGALLSDHVNYLIFRYLQECGHEATARSFYHDWYRPNEYSDPEELPFASHVRRAALVSVIQDGIRYDELQNRVAANAQRRHVWSQLAARHPFSQAKTTLPNTAELSAAKRRSIGSVGIRADEVHPPIPKRQRTIPEESMRVNGHRDAMDIDERSPSAAPDEEDDDDAEAVSPALASEPEVLVTRYDSVATQTDNVAHTKPARPSLKARAIRFAVEKPGSKLFHAAWNPSEQPKHRRTMIVAGEGLCRLYKTPEHLDDSVTTIPHIDEPGVANNSMITAVAWHPSGRVVTCAVDTIQSQGNSGRRATKRSLLDIGPDIGGTISHSNNSSLLQPPGIVLAVEYSPSGDHLLVASTNTTRSLLEVWASPLDGDRAAARTDPIAWCFFEQELTDVAWCEDLQIRACTASNHASILMLPEQLESVAEFTTETIRRHNFIEEILSLPCSPTETSITYKYDNSHWLDLFFVHNTNGGTSNKMIVLDLKHHDASNGDGKPLTFELQQDFTTAALQPSARAESATNGEVRPPSSSTRLLAVAFESGDCQIYELGRINDVMMCRPLHTGNDHSLTMSRGPVLAAAWSPDGSHLALAGDDQVQIWDAPRTESALLDERPVLTWRAESSGTNDAQHVNGVQLDEQQQQQQHVSLSWDALGEKVSFVVDDKVSIIEMERPTAVDQEVVMNGVRAMREGCDTP